MNNQKLLYSTRDKNVKKNFCPGREAMGIIVALIIPIAYAYRDALLYLIPLGNFNYVLN